MDKNYHITRGNYLDYELHPSYTYITEYLDKLNNIIEEIATQFKRVLYVRFDLRFPKSSNYDERAISKFFARLTSELKSNKHKQTSAKYFWVREIDTSSNQHYHCLLLLDYNKTRYAGFPNGHKAAGLMKTVNETWCSILNTQETALVNLCDSNPNFKFINRDEPESKKAIFTHCAYLCKFETKAFNISGKNIGHSQIKHKHQK
ncbi:inovirus-type Gp2 protein [Vibrio cholerae]